VAQKPFRNYRAAEIQKMPPFFYDIRTCPNMEIQPSSQRLFSQSWSDSIFKISFLPL